MCSIHEKINIENLEDIKVALLGASKDAIVKLAEPPLSDTEQNVNCSATDLQHKYAMPTLGSTGSVFSCSEHLTMSKSIDNCSSNLVLESCSKVYY